MKNGAIVISFFLLFNAITVVLGKEGGLRERERSMVLVDEGSNVIQSNTTRRNLGLCFMRTTHSTNFWYVNWGGYVLYGLRWYSRHCSGTDLSYDSESLTRNLNIGDAAMWRKSFAVDMFDYSDCDNGEQYWDVCVEIWISQGDVKTSCFKHYVEAGNCDNAPRNVCTYSKGTTLNNNRPKAYSAGSVKKYKLRSTNSWSWLDEDGYISPWLDSSSNEWKVACDSFDRNCVFDDNFNKQYCYDMDMSAYGSDGIPSYDGKVRCDASCGSCGGTGCGSREGGPDKCCYNTIMDSGNYCGSDDETGCIVPEYLQNFSACDSGIASSGICCDASCGSCGGTGCDRREGGAEKCCHGTIRDSGFYCGRDDDTACIIP